MSRRKQIYEGKAKILYEGPEPGTLVQYFKDDATAFNAQKKADYLQGMFAGIGIKLIDFKIEFGRLDVKLENGTMAHQVLLADEISPDSCRLWDRETDRKMDKDRFRRDLGEVTEAYTEVASRLGILKEANNKSAPNLSVVSNDD